METIPQTSFFGFHFVSGFLDHMGWPRRRSLLSSKAVIDSLVLDSAVDQMIDWVASLGACRSDLALQMIATMFRGRNWDSEASISIVKIVNDSKVLWRERGSSNPGAIVQPIRYAELAYQVSAKALNDGEARFLLEQYCFNGLIWGLANPKSFLQYFEKSIDRENDNLPLYEEMGLDIESAPELDVFLASCEEILKGYEKEIRTLSPIPQKLMEVAVVLGWK